MIHCPSCPTLVKPGHACPHCGAAPSAARRPATLAVVLLGLALAGCPKGDAPAPGPAPGPEPEYGVPAPHFAPDAE